MAAGSVVVNYYTSVRLHWPQRLRYKGCFLSVLLPIDYFWYQREVRDWTV